MYLNATIRHAKSNNQEFLVAEDRHHALRYVGKSIHKIDIMGGLPLIKTQRLIHPSEMSGIKLMPECNPMKVVVIV